MHKSAEPTKFKTGQRLKHEQGMPRSFVGDEAALKADGKSPQEVKQGPEAKSLSANKKKTEISKLTSKRLQDVIPEFNPSSIGSSKRHTWSTIVAPSITVSDENVAMQGTSPHQNKNDLLKPMPSLADPENNFLDSLRQRSNYSAASSSSQSSNSLSVPSPSKIRPRRVFSLRSPSLESEASSTFSSWSRPSSTSSLLPPPLNVGKIDQTSTTNGVPTETEASRFYRGRTRDMYSYETLDYQALLDEVSESPGRRLLGKLPFVKKKSSIDLGRSRRHSPTPEVTTAAQRDQDGSSKQTITPRSWSASTVDSDVATGRGGSPLRIVETALERSASAVSSRPRTSTSTGTQAKEMLTNVSNNTEPTTTTVTRDPRDESPDPLSAGQPSWRCHVPTRCREDESITKLVRTKNGSRILQLREAVYDEEGKLTYKPLMLTSLEANDATRLLLLPLSSSDSDVVLWDSTDTRDVIQGEVCLGRDITGALVNETVVWSRDGLKLGDIEDSLNRSDTKRLARATKGKEKKQN